MSLENPTLPLSRGAGGGAGIGEEDPREVAPMPFVLWIFFIRYGAKTTVSIFTPREGFKKTKWKFKIECSIKRRVGVILDGFLNNIITTI